MQRPPLKTSPTRTVMKRRQKWFASHPRLSRYTKALWPRFTYEPLESRQIRILELQPGCGTETFQGQFIVASIDSNVEYDALSYMWGDSAPVDKILVAGAAIPLASNLSTALRYIRNCKKPHPLRIWIDAICINQNDIKEREEQVSMMRTVYVKAQHVRIWINEPDLVEDDPAIAALCEFRLSSNPANSLGDDANFWKSAISLLTNEYWNRLWIQQEVLNAQHLVLHSKVVMIPGQAVAHFQQALFSTYSAHRFSQSTWANFGINFPLFRTPASSDLFIHHTERGRTNSLVQLLYWCRKAAVARRQDRLYAIMHLANDYEEGTISVDYSKSPVQTMLEVASYHVNRNGNLGETFLHISGWQEELDSDGRALEQDIIPTWIPRVWFGLDTPTDGLVRSYHSRHPARTRCLPFSVDTSTRRLSARGVQVGYLGHLLRHQFRHAESTIGQFWSSDFGKFLTSGIDGNWQHLSRDVTKTLAASSYEGIRHEDVVTILEHLSLLGREVTLLHAIGTCPPSTVRREVFTEFMADLQNNVAFSTRAGYFGSAQLCGLKEGDQIWMILGCNTPVIVRPQPNGTYWHICTTYIPKVIEDENIVQHLTSEVQLGDKVGQWIVQDIQLE